MEHRRTPTLATERLLTDEGGARTGLHLSLALYFLISCAAPYLFGNLLAALLVGGLVLAAFANRRLPMTAFAWTITLGSLGTFSVLYGVHNGNPGALSVASVYLVEPLVLGLLLPLTYCSLRDLRWLTSALDVALVATAALGVALYLESVLGLGLPLERVIDQRFTAVDLSTGVLRTNYQGYNSFVFLAPYGLARCVSGATLTRRTVLGLAVFSGLLLSGRSVLFLSTPIALACAYGLMRREKQSRRAKVRAVPIFFGFIGAMTVMTGLLLALGLSPSSVVERTANAITVQDKSGIRLQQSRILLDEWLESPLIGHGAGRSVQGYVRDLETPWSYELSYHVLLMNVGVLGMLVLFAWGAWTVWRLRLAAPILRPLSTAIMSGFLGAVVAAATNPYFFKIEGLWMAFLPFAVAVCASNAAWSPAVDERSA